MTQLPYDDAVQEAKPIVARLEKDQWRLGELADRVEPKYGEQTLEQFAKDIGIKYKTLKVYRSVFRSWQGKGSPENFSVAKELMAHPDREQIVAANPDMTKAEAHKQMEDHRAPFIDGTDENNKLKASINRGKNYKELEALAKAEKAMKGKQEAMRVLRRAASQDALATQRGTEDWSRMPEHGRIALDDLTKALALLVKARDKIITHNLDRTGNKTLTDKAEEVRDCNNRILELLMVGPAPEPVLPFPKEEKQEEDDKPELPRHAAVLPKAPFHRIN